MPVVKSKPTSAGRRHQVKVTSKDLHKGKPYAPLLEKKSKTGGRNNAGRITTRHIGGGHKHHYRVIDFKRTKDGIPAKVERIENDPNRTAQIALDLNADGERRYILAPKGISAGDVLYSGSAIPSRPVIACQSATFRWVLSSTLLSCSPVRAPSSLAPPAPPCSWWPGKGSTPPFGCAPVRCARFRSIAGRP